MFEVVRLTEVHKKLLCIRASNWSRDRMNKLYNQSKAPFYSASEYTAECLFGRDKQAYEASNLSGTRVPF